MSNYDMSSQVLQNRLGERLGSEVPRSELDLRHRLDSQGNRYGKVLDYKYGVQAL